MAKKNKSSSAAMAAMIFTSQAGQISTQAAMVWNEIKGKADCDLGNGISTDSFTVAAVNTKRIQTIQDIGSTVRTLVLGQGDKSIIFDKYDTVIRAWSTAPFTFQPFLVIQENGESITNTNYNGDSIPTALDNALGVQSQERILGPAHKAQLDYINGTPYWSVSLKVDFMPMIPRYVKSCQDREMTEDDPAYVEMRLGAIATGAAGTVVNYARLFDYLFHSKERKLSVM